MGDVLTPEQVGRLSCVIPNRTGDEDMIHAAIMLRDSHEALRAAHLGAEAELRRANAERDRLREFVEKVARIDTSQWPTPPAAVETLVMAARELLDTQGGGNADADLAEAARRGHAARAKGGGDG